MPYSRYQRLSTGCVWTMVVLAAIVFILLPLTAEAGYDFNTSGDGPSGDGQPDDIGNAPRPDLGQSVARIIHLLTQWMNVWVAHLGWGGVFS